MVRLGAVALLASCASPCLVRFAVAAAAKSDGPTTAEAGTDRLNVTRTARINVPAPKLTKDTTLEDQAKQNVMQAYTEHKCQYAEEFFTRFNRGVAIKLQEAPTDSSVKKAIVAAYEKGLESLTTYDKVTEFDESKVEPYQKSLELHNLVFMMHHGFDKVGCAVSKDCGENTLLVCNFSPELKKGVPLTKELYDAMMSRKAAKVSLLDLTENDLNTKLDKAGSGAAAVPIAAGIIVSLIGLMVVV